MAGRDLARLGCALLVGMALAFPAGLMVAGQGDEDAPRPRGDAAAERRNVFSPHVRDDPYFREQQRRNVEALEAHCRDSGALCAEAEQARRWIEQAD